MRAISRVVLGAPWTPARLGSALQLWVSADTGVTSSGLDVTGLADQSGMGYNLSRPTGSYAQYDAAGFNGLPTINFLHASNNTNLRTGTDAVTTMGGTTASFYCVGQIETATLNYARAITFTQSGQVDYTGANSVAAILRDGSNAGFAFYQGNASGTAMAATTNANHRFGMIFDGTNGTPYLDGVAGTATAKNFTFGSAATIVIGNHPNIDAEWEGPISEVVITNTALSPDDRAKLDEYFVKKWGL